MNNLIGLKMIFFSWNFVTFRCVLFTAVRFAHFVVLSFVFGVLLFHEFLSHLEHASSVFFVEVYHLHFFKCLD